MSEFKEVETLDEYEKLIAQILGDEKIIEKKVQNDELTEQDFKHQVVSGVNELKKEFLSEVEVDPHQSDESKVKQRNNFRREINKALAGVQAELMLPINKLSTKELVEAMETIHQALREADEQGLLNDELGEEIYEKSVEILQKTGKKHNGNDLVKLEGVVKSVDNLAEKTEHFWLNNEALENAKKALKRADELTKADADAGIPSPFAKKLDLESQFKEELEKKQEEFKSKPITTPKKNLEKEFVTGIDEELQFSSPKKDEITNSLQKRMSANPKAYSISTLIKNFNRDQLLKMAEEKGFKFKTTKKEPFKKTLASWLTGQSKPVIDQAKKGQGAVGNNRGFTHRGNNRKSDRSYQIGRGMVMGKGGEFGKLMIDPKKLKLHHLVARKGKKKVADGSVSKEVIDLLTKRFNPKRNYGEEALNMFKELAKMAELPIDVSGSQKTKLLAPKKTGVKFYKGPKELVNRLQVLMGSWKAGNKATEIINEASEIADKLLSKGVIDQSKFQRLMTVLGV